VKKDQILAEIDAPDIVNEYGKLKAAHDFQKVTRNRYKELLADQVISQQEFDQVDAAYSEANARYQGAAAEMEYTHIRAPFSGSIARRNKLVGDLITPGKGDEAPIFLLVNEARLRVVVNAPQSSLSDLKIGSPVDIRVDTFPGQTFKGVISGLDDVLDSSSKTQRVLVDIDNPDRKLHAGMFATVIIHFAEHDNVLTVSADALQKFEGKDVLYLNDNDSVKKVEIQIGLRKDDRVEVSGAIHEGEQVLLPGTQALSDGEKIHVIQDK